MKISGNGVLRQDTSSSAREEKKAVSNTFEALLDNQVARIPQPSDRTAPISETARAPFSIVSPQGTKVLDQGEIKFFENMLSSLGSPGGKGARGVQDQLQSAIRINRMA